MPFVIFVCLLVVMNLHSWKTVRQHLGVLPSDVM